MKKNLLLLAAGLVMSAAVADAATVYFENTAAWSPVNAYSWTSGNSNAGWPGVEVTETVSKDGHTYYKYETEFANIIFNNGADQTKDLIVIDNMIYNAAGATGELFNGGTVELTTDVYLTGSINDWSTNSAEYKFTDKGNGIYTYTIASITTADEFKVYSTTESYLGYTDSLMDFNVEYVLGDTGMVNCQVAADGSNITFIYNANNNTLVLSTDGYDNPEPPVNDDVTVPDVLYVVGNLNIGNWTPVEGGVVELTKAGNVFTGVMNIVDAGAGLGYFSFVTALGSDWDADVNSSNRFGPYTQDQLIATGDASTFQQFTAGVNASSAYSWSVAPGVYNVEVDFNNMMITLGNSETGVEAVEAAAEAPVYFDLQGNKVANPENGLYIKVVGDKAVKVLVK